jgi:hypothetical protein
MDFIVIGAARTGTTALYSYLHAHPELLLPKDKDAPFFTDERLYRRGYDRFRHDFFAPAQRRIVGAVTPQYLCDPAAAARIAGVFPGCKLIVMLRDPVERAYSHYRMGVQQGLEPCSFQQSVQKQLEPGALNLVRAARTACTDEHAPPAYLAGKDCTVALGEYGRILQPYFDLFPREQIWIGFHSDFERDCAGCYRSILQFLGVDSSFRPANLGQRVFVGGTRAKLPVHAIIRRLPGALRLWRLLPVELRIRLNFRFTVWNVRPEQPARAWSVPLDDITLSRLRTLYERDRELLERLIGRPAPWPHGISNRRFIAEPRPALEIVARTS